MKIRIAVKSMTIIVLLLGIVFPLVAIEGDFESPGNSYDSIDGIMINVYSNRVLGAEVDITGNEPTLTEPNKEIGLQPILQFLLIAVLIILGISLYYNVQEIKTGKGLPGFITFIGYIAFLLHFLIIWGNVNSLINASTVENGKLLFDKEGNLNVYIIIHKSFLYYLLNLSVILLTLLPITNRIFKTKDQQFQNIN